MSESAATKLLSKALKFEREGMEYYTKAREKTRHPAARGIFELLAGEEKKHADFLTGLHAALKKEGRWPEEVTVDLARDFKAIFAQASRSIDKTVHISTSETEALRFAMDMEKRGREMYLDLSKKAKNAAEKSLYERLAEWEKAHYEYVEEFHGFFQDEGLVMNE